MSAPEPSPDAPFFIILNAGSGREQTQRQRATIEQALDQAGRAFKLSVVEDPGQIDAIACQMVDAAKAAGAIVVAAGGDGTINAVAARAAQAACPFGVLPQGTFNYFGRAHGIPEDLGAAVQALIHARMRPVQVGLVNDRIFLVNASIGLYPQVLQEREVDKKQFGRSRIVALFSMLKTALSSQQYLRISMEVERKHQVLHTPTLFVGNNRLQMEQLGMSPMMAALEDGQLAAIAPKPVGRLGMMKLLLLGALGRLGQAQDLVVFGFKEMTVKQITLYGKRRRIKVATDGEVMLLDTPLRFRVLEGQLLLMKSQEAAAPARDLDAA
jgi:diacylglycerol kinase family enzyme